MEVIAGDLNKMDIQEDNIPEGRSLLHEAAKRGYTEQIQEILAEESNEQLRAKKALSIDTTNSTPLHWAASGGHVDAVKYLLQFYPQGNNTINAVNQFGDTALHRAAWKQHPEVCELLLQQGAQPSISIKNAEGKTPLDLARNMDVKRLVSPPQDFGDDEEFDQEDEDSD
eukprot:TRINITY_DN1958_c0_g1_i1.p1 TRINITY_DN1958_c0_g1~~TRINITY_DN1958_c0_g1_i1.p1  ORF type:complete len:170 (-),score=35.02 TRINITY_DN1958_c0_g1_i1:35-544(-)